MNKFVFESQDFHKLNQANSNPQFSTKLSDQEYKFSLCLLPFLCINAFKHFKNSSNWLANPISSKIDKIPNFLKE
jgi:hypothetical protein